MKISLFIADFTGGGAERVFANLAGEFSKRGHDVDLVIGNAEHAVYLDELPASVRLVDLKVSRMLKSLPKLTKYLREQRPDVLLATRVHSCCFSVLANILTGSKTAVVLREANTITLDLEKYSLLKRSVLSTSIRILYPLADAIVGVSYGVAQDLKKRLPGVEDKLHIVYSPVITDDLLLRAADPVDHPWFDKNSAPVILSAGRLTEQKKFDHLFKAFAIVRRKMQARLLILGEGELRESLKKLIADLNLKPDIELMGFDVNPFKFMAKSRLFVMTSAWEGLPGVLIQALACGCPVISTDCPSGPREILKEGKLGKLVPVGDVDRMAFAIEESLNDNSLTVDPQELDEYTAQNSTEHYLRIFENLQKR